MIWALFAIGLFVIVVRGSLENIKSKKKYAEAEKERLRTQTEQERKELNQGKWMIAGIIVLVILILGTCEV